MASSKSRDPQIVYQDTNTACCPACGHKGEPFVVSTSSTSAGGVALTTFILFASALACACCFLMGGMDSSLTFFCQRCGLRLISESNVHSNVKYHESDMIPEQAVSDKAIALPSPKTVKSPVGLPVAVNKDWIVNPQRRFSNITPVRKLGIEKGRYKIPTSFISTTPGYTMSFTVGIPGMAPEGLADRKEAQYLLSSNCAWNRHESGPHFQVFMQSESSQAVEIAQVRLCGTISNVDIKVVDHEAATGKKWTTYQMQAEQEISWSLTGAGVLWRSSQGVLMWNFRKLSSDGDGAKGLMLCLLDAYDRLVAAVWKTKRPGGEVGQWWEMRVYVDVSDDFLGEVIASYVAVRVQNERIAQAHLYDSG
ncbi:hypothetical protein FLONG3_785 [Fusarium longipes]|uniref:LITAF domain-containing protein n=1 Tax=Fusarium longipes TaxID=694270 RepID=A0A395T919_9HYPO|nr:hypothetical protein FLONG3_785 [Fusarium longipes]